MERPHLHTFFQQNLSFNKTNIVLFSHVPTQLQGQK